MKSVCVTLLNAPTLQICSRSHEADMRIADVEAQLSSLRAERVCSPASESPRAAHRQTTFDGIVIHNDILVYTQECLVPNRTAMTS